MQAQEGTIKALQGSISERDEALIRVNKELLQSVAIVVNRFSIEICLRNFHNYLELKGKPNMTRLCEDFAKKHLLVPGSWDSKHPTLNNDAKELLKHLEHGAVDANRVAEKTLTVYKFLSEDIHFLGIIGKGVLVCDGRTDPCWNAVRWDCLSFVPKS